MSSARSAAQSLLALVLVVAGACCVACGADAPQQDSMWTKDEQRALADSSQPPAPEVLEKLIAIFLDPAVSPDDKIGLLEGSEADPTVFDTIALSYDGDDAPTYDVLSPVLPGTAPGTARANVQIEWAADTASDYTGTIPFIYEDGTWMIAKPMVCHLLSGVNVNSRMCTAS
jgi:hypothetical protein